MEEVVKTSIEIPREILAEIKSLATRKGTTQNKIMNELIVKGLKNDEKSKRKIKAKLINDKLPKVNATKKYDSLKDMAGIVKLDHKTDSVKLKNSIYTDKAGF